MPTVSAHVTHEVADLIKLRAQESYYRGKVSAFLADLIEKALKEENTASMTSEEKARLAALEESVRLLLEAAKIKKPLKKGR
tara:strand:- start:1 stop:246 length:246 start_codon:yes stop_codon:yes gene_type:complete